MEKIIVVLGIPLLIVSTFLFTMRNQLIRKMTDLADGTGLPEWKAWRLSALEPIITTLVALIWSLMMLSNLAFQAAFILPMVNMGLFALLIRWRGKGCQRGRLANTVIFARLALLLIPLLLIGNAPFPLIPMLIILLIPPFALRVIFTLYQSHVTPTLVEYEREHAAGNIRIPAIEAGEDRLGGLDLWNAQVDLIEQLKEEIFVAHN